MYDVVSRDGRPATTCCTTTVDRSQGSLVSDTVPYRDTSPYRQLVSPSMKRPGVMYDLVRDMSLRLEDAAIGTTLAINTFIEERPSCSSSSLPTGSSKVPGLLSLVSQSRDSAGIDGPFTCMVSGGWHLDGDRKMRGSFSAASRMDIQHHCCME
jgi:hypothetical protein